MRRTTGLLAVGAVLALFFVTCSPKGEEILPVGKEKLHDSYQLVLPSELALKIDDYQFEGNRVDDADGGYRSYRGHVGKLSCGNISIELASSEFKDGYIVTKRFGKIRVRRTSPPIGFAFFLTPSQRRELEEYCSS